MCAEKKYSSLINTESVRPILNQISIFGGLSKEQLYVILQLLQRITYKAGETIFKQGDDPTHIYIVERGEVKIVAEIEAEHVEIIKFGAGQCFGEMAVIGIQPHSADAIAVVDTELIVITGESLLSIYETDKELFGKLILNIAREACRRLHRTDEVLLHYVHKKSST